MIVEMGRQYCYGPKDNQVKVRILCTDAPGNHPVIGVNQLGSVFRWTIDGYFKADREESYYDLREFRPRYRREFWVNVYPVCQAFPLGVRGMYASRDEADNSAYKDRISCQHVILEGEEGEGMT